jgi:parallel beta-helix repeat protein
MRRPRSKVEETRLVSAIVAFVFCLSAALGLLVSSSPNRTDTAVRDGPTGNGLTPARALVFTPHDPIFIDGDEGFTNASGVVWGSGTESDPYIIEGWDINASTANGIEIRNTDVRFIVTACHLYDGRWNYGHGIYLVNCANGTLDGNICSNNVCGIWLYTSSGNTLSNNTCSNNTDYGICLDSSYDNTLINNSMIDDGIALYGDSLSCWNTHSIDTSNAVNGKPVYYLKNLDGATVPAGAGQVLLANCTNTVIRNQNLSDTDIGIEVGFCSNLLVNDNSCSNNAWYGIFLDQSSGNTVSNNSCSNNEYGIFIYMSSGNVLSNNSCSNNEYGVGLYTNSIYNTLSNNSCSNNGYGICVWDSNDNALSSNVCSINGYGILLKFSFRTTLSNNSCSNNVYCGIYLHISNRNTIGDNTCSSNNGFGVYIYQSNDNNMTRNQILNNDGYGVFVSSFSGNNGIWNNSFAGNNGAESVYSPSHVQAYDDWASNWWSSVEGYGNYWSDWTGPDADMNGIVDAPYSLDGSLGAAMDYYPLTMPQTPIPEFEMMPLVVMILLVAVVLTIGVRRKKV